MEFQSRYVPSEIEDKIYKKWEESGLFSPEENSDKESFTIVMPPPNVTGVLHLGHALDLSLQDLIIRFKRMQGFNALWIPGTDHASIATEVKVVERLRSQGIDKLDLGREEFLKHAWSWKEEKESTIISQIKKLGLSCDWSRLRFTMDQGLSDAVLKVFVDLYEKGLIYRGERLVNWCPDCKTSLSDAEVEHEEKQGSFWHIRYFFKDSKDFLSIATTRPETMLGDTALAVNPEDERYKHLIGKTIILPLMNREIPIVADDYVDPLFGTGVVKITPAHDPNDFEVGLRHDLPQLVVMDETAKINSNGGIYCGMDRYEARKKIIKDLEEGGFLEKTEEHQHNVGECYRCNTTIEPLLSTQWFVKMEPLAKPALECVRNGETSFVPERYSKVYFHWMENIRDWCISRQLWWGHQIPAYYCEECNELVVSIEKPDRCKSCSCERFRQDEDVLDTWFSSALWPFSTLGWPENTEDVKRFYPTNVLVTGYEIIFFWVARMIFSGIEHMGTPPFKEVLIHGMVRDAQGRKMSKSLDNGIDPLLVIEEFGSDALRMALLSGASSGNDMRYHEEKIEAYRNFANKVWNASRFVWMNLEDFDYQEKEMNSLKLELEDKWILSGLADLSEDLTRNMEKYNFSTASQLIYDFIWSKYCDWYIELTKSRLYNKEEPESRYSAQYVNWHVSTSLLKLLHPFMPYLTHELFNHLHQENDKFIMIEKWPEKSEMPYYPEDAVLMESLIEAIGAVRNMRGEVKIPLGERRKVCLSVDDEMKYTFLNENSRYFTGLAQAESVEVFKLQPGEEPQKMKCSANSFNKGIYVTVLLSSEDVLKEKQRLEKQIIKISKQLEGLQKRLNSEGFLSKAPEKVVTAEREKAQELEAQVNQLNLSLTVLESEE